MNLERFCERYSEDEELQRLGEMNHDTMLLVEDGLATQLITSMNKHVYKSPQELNIDSVYFHIRQSLRFGAEYPFALETTLLFMYHDNQSQKFIGHIRHLDDDNFLGTKVIENLITDEQATLLHAVAVMRPPVHGFALEANILNRRRSR